MKTLAPSNLYFYITNDIEDYVQNGRDCHEVVKAPIGTELFSWPMEVRTDVESALTMRDHSMERCFS